MLHRYIDQLGSHFAANIDAEGTHILVQLGGLNGNWSETRLRLTKEEAIEFANLILEKAGEIE